MSGFLHQRRIRVLGEIIDTVFTAMPFLSAYSILSTTIILYEVIKPYFLNVIPWMNVGYFFAVLFVTFVPVMLFVYKWVIPSVWHFRSTQMSHLEGKIDDQSRAIRDLTAKVDELLGKKP